MRKVRFRSVWFVVAAWLVTSVPMHAAEQQDYAKEEKRFEEQIANDPTNPEHVYNLGVAQYKQKKFEQAKQNFERSAAASDKNVKVRSLFNLGNTHIQLGDLQGAKQALQQALSYDLENKAIKENLEWVDQQLKNNPEQQKQQQSEQQQANDSQKSQDSTDQQGEQQQDSEQKGDQKQADNKQGSGQNQDEKKEDQQAGGQGSEKNESDQKKDQNQSAQGGNEQDQKNQDSKSQNSQNGDQQADGNPNQPGDQDKQDNPQSQGGNGQPGDGNQKGQSGQRQEGKHQVSNSDVKKQDAERIVRSVEDDVSKSLYRPGDLGKKGEGGEDSIDW
jgi:Ca-activated chloride channel homolog